MRLFTYKQKYDTGFAPNPFHGTCTLATCKAKIRLKKGVGDWIAGFTSAFLNRDPVGGERLIYLMEVSKKIGLDEYHRTPDFAAKIPQSGAPRCVDRTGDNIYYLQAGQMRQVENPSHGPSEFEDDTSGEFVLIAHRFYYFGSKPLVVPGRLRPDVPYGVAGHGVETSDRDRARAFIDWVHAQRGPGVHAAPHRWPPGDESWRQS
jgi:Nucleotide modification associated domain 2